MSEITNAEEFSKKSKQKLDIPGFSPGEILTIRVKKPAILTMMAEGKIPNPLIGAVSSIMGHSGVKQQDSKANLPEFGQIIEFFCQVSMIEPTFEEVRDDMTDEQMLYIFNWVMGGAQKLSNFRKNKENGASDNFSQTVQQKTKRNSRDKR